MAVPTAHTEYKSVPVAGLDGAPMEDDAGEETEVGEDTDSEEPQRNVRQRVEPASPAPVVVAADLVVPTVADLLAQQREVLTELRAMREARERDAAEIRALRADVGYPALP